MADVRVMCINKPNRDSTVSAITHLGGEGWKWTRQQVVDSIKAKSNTFYVWAGGKRADIGVLSNGHIEYVQTYSDGQWDNNLLSLPECVS